MKISGSAKDSCFRLPALLAAVLLYGVGIATADAATVTRQIPSSGTATFPASTTGVDGLQNPELDPGLASLDIADGPSVNANGVNANCEQRAAG